MIERTTMENWSNERLIDTLEGYSERTEKMVRELLKRSASDTAAPGESNTFGLESGMSKKYAEAAQSLQKLDPPEDIK